MKGLFFDASFTMLAKNHYPIAKYFSEKKENFESIFLSVEISSNLNAKVEEKSLETLNGFTNSQLLKCPNFNSSKISKILEKYSPDFVIIGAYRIYDQLLCALCKIRGIKVYNFQHGFEVNSVNYTVGGSLAKIKKSFKLLRTSYDLGGIISVNRFLFLRDYVSYILMGKNQLHSGLRNTKLHPFHSFVYSDWYKEFWNNKFGLDQSAMSLITPPDFLLIESVKKEPVIDGVCYITQTLVEDGRMTEKAFLQLLQDYKEIARKVNKFVIKLHPRAKVEYYDVFEEMDNVVIQREFPNSKVYLTHYSSMIFAASYLSKNLILHELEGHPTPDLFMEVSPVVARDITQLTVSIQRMLNNSRSKPPGSLSIENFQNPYDFIVEKILEDYSLDQVEND